jgi:hypothetical protein
MRFKPFINAKIFVGLISAMGLHAAAFAQVSDNSNMSRDNLMVVLRESVGANKQDDTLIPSGKMKASLPDGHEIEFEIAAFELIGDMHIRFVFDGPDSMRNATPQDLSNLKLSTVDALKLSIANIERVYGPPKISTWAGGVMQVQGKSPDLDSSYFLDRAFWDGVAKAYPDGLVVAVPKRGGLLFVPLSDTKDVKALQKSVGTLYSSSERLRVSSALYLFKGNKWSLFQAPLTE